VDFGPDGNHLAIGSQGGVVKIFNGTPLAFGPVYQPLPEEF
jgi:hypothetical protein